MFKKNLCLTFISCLIIPTFSYAGIECSAVNFDLHPNPVNRTVSLAKDDQQFHLIFSATQEGHKFHVVVEKSSMDVYGNIETADGITHNFTGAFSSSGRFEFATMSGGNIMMPGTLIGLNCLKK